MIRTLVDGRANVEFDAVGPRLHREGERLEGVVGGPRSIASVRIDERCGGEGCSCMSNAPQRYRRCHRLGRNYHPGMRIYNTIERAVVPFEPWPRPDE